MKQCHLTLLATLHDTYGFSVLEGFSHGLPAITSDVCALPEFVSGSSSTMANGHLLHLPKDGRGCWLHEPDAISSDYWEMLDQAFSSMALQTFLFLESLARNPGRLEELSRNAIKTLEQRHSQYSLARALEDIYRKAKYCGLSQSGQLAGNQTAAK
jgi:glycosyltransferase involved in cell wall biosynthesis